MKFCSLVFQLHLPQNFCHTHTDTQTQIFQKQSNRVQDIPKRVNSSKTGNRKFAQKQYFLLLIQKKVKKCIKREAYEKNCFSATVVSLLTFRIEILQKSKQCIRYTFYAYFFLSKYSKSPLLYFSNKTHFMFYVNHAHT